MARVYQVPQHAFIWLMSGAMLASLPHLISGPGWLTIMVLCLQVWRILVQRGRLRMPSRVSRVAVLILAIAGTLYSFGTVLGPAAGINLLICAFNLKLLEMHKMRDAYVVIVLNYFVLATVLIAQTDFFTALYVFFALFIVTAALIGINQAEANIRARQQLRYAGVLVLQSFPLMIFLFVVVPRVAPLWDLKVDKKEARTGMSDSMAPGEVSQLSRSAALAFRVQFEGDLPPPAQRYWRGLTFSWFDGHRWSQALPDGIPFNDVVTYPQEDNAHWYARLRTEATGPSYQYQVIMEPTSREWLYALAVPFVTQSGIGVVSDYRLLSSTPVTDRLSYQVNSFTQMSRGADAPEWELRFNRRLPKSGNARARRLARQWREESMSDEAYVRRVMNMYRQQPFTYTLEPPVLAGDQIDDFLFRTRAGFCEHFASSFAFLMRAAGIPARIVAGYQGGEANPLSTYLQVRQYDAHAWVEIWSTSRGWQELDPTAMVSPERIEFGLERALATQGEDFSRAFNEVVGLRRLPLLQQFSNIVDYVEFNWTKVVLGYDGKSQNELLKKWLGEVSPLRVAMLIAAGVALVGIFFAAMMMLRGRPQPLTWWQKEYWILYRALQKKGVPASETLGPRALTALICRLYPETAAAATRWRNRYERAAYRAAGSDANADGGVAVGVTVGAKESMKRTTKEDRPGIGKSTLRQLRRDILRRIP